MPDSVVQPAAQPNPEAWSMGLRGAVGAVANLTATALIALMFYQSQLDLRSSAREDRSAYRDELRTMHTDADRQWQAIAKSQAAVDFLTKTVEEQRQATQQLVDAVKSLTAEVRELKTAKPNRGD